MLVPKAGVEPARRCRRRILSPLRLPFRHFGRSVMVGVPPPTVNRRGGPGVPRRNSSGLQIPQDRIPLIPQLEVPTSEGLGERSLGAPKRRESVEKVTFWAPEGLTKVPSLVYK
jgi:hypothetical protein